MTETQIAFADINVGDKIRSVSPCGTERVGVAKFVTGTYVDDAEGLTIAEPSWTIYRIEPPEPNWFGPVGTVVEEDGELSYVVRMQGYSNPIYKTVDSISGRVKGYDWSDLLTLGTFTAVKP